MRWAACTHASRSWTGSLTEDELVEDLQGISAPMAHWLLRVRFSTIERHTIASGERQRSVSLEALKLTFDAVDLRSEQVIHHIQGLLADLGRARPCVRPHQQCAER